MAVSNILVLRADSPSTARLRTFLPFIGSGNTRLTPFKEQAHYRPLGAHPGMREAPVLIRSSLNDDLDPPVIVERDQVRTRIVIGPKPSRLDQSRPHRPGGDERGPLEIPARRGEKFAVQSLPRVRSLRGRHVTYHEVGTGVCPRE